MLEMMLAGLAFGAAPKPCWAPHGGRTMVEFRTHAELVAAEQVAAAAAMRDPEPVDTALQIIVHVERNDIGAASLNYALVVLSNDSGEVFRGQPDGNPLANLPGGTYHMWWSLGVVNLTEMPALPLSVNVVDTLESHRCTWLVSATGGVTLIK